MITGMEYEFDPDNNDYSVYLLVKIENTTYPHLIKYVDTELDAQLLIKQFKNLGLY